MKVPKLHEQYVRSFCYRVVPNSQPCHVPLQPLAGAPMNECFSVVPEQVRRRGGEQVVGWAIWEWRKVMIEAEFHAVWRDPDGNLVDITPKPFKMPKILFLPDPNRRYEGMQVDNRRYSLGKDPRIERFITLAERHFALLNEGDLAHQYGALVMSPEIREVRHEMSQIQLALAEHYGMPC